MRFQRVVDELPADFRAMRRKARAEGHQFLDRLASDWASGAMCFDRPGEVLLAAYSEGVLAAIGGITVDPIVAEALRMRRFYVRSAFRRTGLRARDCLCSARRCAPKSSSGDPQCRCRECPFWEALGFEPEVRDGHTHIWRETEPKR